MGRLRIVTLAGLGLLAAVSTASAGGGEIGGPPSRDPDRCLKLVRPCTDPVVIGIGHHFNGPTEVVAYHSRIGLCIDFDRRDGSSGSCGGNEPEPPEGKAIFANGWEYASDPGGWSGISGFLRPDVASVVIHFRRDGERERAKATVAQVSGELLDAIHEDEPFGVFESLVRGCVKAKRFRAVALDAFGEVLGRSRVPFRRPCRGDAGSVGIVVAPKAETFG
jgi:hypothetical protein